MLKNIYIIILILKITLLFSFINPLFAKDKFIIKRDFKPNSYLEVPQIFRGFGEGVRVVLYIITTPEE